jgi:multidrug efflux pump subunit AcrA (membrane-fusion protein)
MKRIGCCCFAAILLVGGCSGREEKPKAEGERPVVTGVRIETIKPEMLDEMLEAVGTVRSQKQSVLSSKIVASVAAVHGREGDRVKLGQAVVELDDRDVKAQLHRAEAALREATHAREEVERAILAQEKAIDAVTAQEELALATFNRYKALLERRSVAPQEYDEVAAKHKAALAEAERSREMKAALLAKRGQTSARIEQAEAEVSNATVLVGYTTIRAPINGIVVAKTVEVGNLATPGVPLITIEEERYRLEATIQESEIRKLRVGHRVGLTIEALGRELSGAIVEIVPAADPMSRTFTVKIDLPATPGLRSGLYGKARLMVGRQEALVISRKATIERGQLVGVFVLDPGGIARLRLIKTGKVYGDRIEILSGLSPGERIVVEGVEKVSDGSRVQDEE